MDKAVPPCRGGVAAGDGGDMLRGMRAQQLAVPGPRRIEPDESWKRLFSSPCRTARKRSALSGWPGGGSCPRQAGCVIKPVHMRID